MDEPVNFKDYGKLNGPAKPLQSYHPRYVHKAPI